jgi:undecaprenyl-diphosphatase
VALCTDLSTDEAPLTGRRATGVRRPTPKKGVVAVTTPPQPLPPATEPTPRAVAALRWARPGVALIGAGLAMAAVFVVLLMVGSAPTASAVLHAPQAIVLGAVEGITEFLPISSTGHLIITERLLGLGGTKASLVTLDSYAVIIQGGAILAVAWLYWRRLWTSFAALAGSLRLPGFRRRPVSPADRRVAVAILVAVAPAGLIGFVAGDAVQHRLFSPVPIALAWIAGGAALLAVAGWLHGRGSAGDDGGFGLDRLTWQAALIVGLAQALALWPGVSRSLVTIVAGCLVGLTLSAAVELSFLVGFVVLLAASGLEILKHGNDIISAYGWVNPLLGLAVAFVCAVVSIRWLLRIISGRSLAGFGWYRLGAAAVVFGLLAAGRI